MRLCAALALFLGLAASASADVEKGVEAWKRGEYRAALEQFRPAAEQGDARVAAGAIFAVYEKPAQNGPAAQCAQKTHGDGGHRQARGLAIAAQVS